MAAEDDGGKRVNIGVRLLPSTIAALDEAGERMGGRSRAFVIELLTGLFAPELDERTRVPVGLMPAGTRAKKSEPPVSEYVTPKPLPPAKKPRKKS